VTLTLRVTGSVLKGSMSVFGQTEKIYEGKLASARASWKVKIPNQTPPLILEFASTINGPTMSGTVTSPHGTVHFTGTQTAHSVAAGIRRLLGLARS
jgi:hypothetical protein